MIASPFNIFELFCDFFFIFLKNIIYINFISKILFYKKYINNIIGNKSRTWLA